MKTCTKCGEARPSERFSKDKSTKDGLRNRCRACMSGVWKAAYAADPERWKKRSRDWSKDNPEKKKQVQRNADFKTNYGITTVDFEAQRTRQGGKCAVCADLLTRGKMGAHVDHDHKTGKVREILCRWCNLGLGNFKDSPERLLAAVAYLKKHSA